MNDAIKLIYRNLDKIKSSGDKIIISKLLYTSTITLIDKDNWDENTVYTTSGGKFWYKNNKRHREDGPAVMRAGGYKSWWVNGLRHREDGPAIIYTDGIEAWYLNDTRLTEEQFNERSSRR